LEARKPEGKLPLKFRQLPGLFAICQLPAAQPIPEWAASDQFFSVTRTQEELSIVGPQASVPAEVKADRGWICLKLQGPFPFSQTGVLSSFIGPLSANAIPIFAISTYDTDYVLIKEGFRATALMVLQAAGHERLDNE